MAVRAVVPGLTAAWRNERDLVQRALLRLAAAFPDIIADHITPAPCVPEVLSSAWSEELARPGEGSELDDAAIDRRQDVERWALAGWTTG